MSKYNVPHTFIPGTKAKANEVNENFIAILDYISQTKDISADINFSNITTTAKETIYNNSSQGRLIGEIITSTLPISDACVHLLDGAIISNTGIYKDFVNHIARLYANSSATPAYFTSETEWQNSINTYGVCGKFVYNATNKTVRLPKITGIIEGTSDSSKLGDVVQAGLPNHYHTITMMRAQKQGQGTKTVWSYAENDQGYGTVTSDLASVSNNIYGKSNTVQPQTIKVYYYIVLAEAAKTEIKIDIDNITTEVNSKASTNLSNITNDATSLIALNSMPSTKFTDLTIVASSNYTAPANGWFSLSGKDTAVIETQKFVLRNKNTRYFGITGYAENASAAWCCGVLPVKKGDSVGLYIQNINADTHNFRFYYAKGSESED